MRVRRGWFRPSQLAPKSFSKLSTYKLIGSIPLSIQYRRAALLNFSNKFTVRFPVLEILWIISRIPSAGMSGIDVITNFSSAEFFFFPSLFQERFY